MHERYHIETNPPNRTQPAIVRSKLETDHSGRTVSLQSYVSSAYQAASAMQRQQHEFLGNSYQQMMALRQQQHQQQHQLQQQQQQQQQQGSIAGTGQSPFLQWNMPERSEATLQDFMENNSQAIVPANMSRLVHTALPPITNPSVTTTSLVANFILVNYQHRSAESPNILTSNSLE